MHRPTMDRTMTCIIQESLNAIRARVDACRGNQPVCLVAVSKTKSTEDIMQAYRAGQRHFGENYIQEIVSKAPLLPDDIKWHFIGHLQGNKLRTLLSGVPNLYCIETVDSRDHARKLNQILSSQPTTNCQLRIFIQVNTSGEEQKGGLPCSLDAVMPLISFIQQEGPNLLFAGLMTIGSASNSQADMENEDFSKLFWLREQIAQALSMEPTSLELSMGMSMDFEQAIKQGSTNVRVGSLIFGSR